MNAQTVLLVGSAPAFSGLTPGEKDAYEWALKQYGAAARYISFIDIANSGIPASVKVIWYHLEDTPNIPNAAGFSSGDFDKFLEKGGVLLTSGFAPIYLFYVKASSVPPNVLSNKDSIAYDPAWGLRPLDGMADHPVFAGLTAATDWSSPNWGGFRTISPVSLGREVVCLWGGGKFPGTPIGCYANWNPADPSWPAIGEIAKGKGRAMFISAPGYHWLNAAANTGAPKANLERLTLNALQYLEKSSPLVSADEAQPLLSDIRASPNPGVDGFSLSFSLKAPAADVVFEFFDLQGRRIGQAPQGPLAAGAHTLRWTADKPLPKGLYVYRLRSGAALLGGGKWIAE